jgi:hypothetical protein
LVQLSRENSVTRGEISDAAVGKVTRAQLDTRIRNQAAKIAHAIEHPNGTFLLAGTTPLRRARQESPLPNTITGLLTGHAPLDHLLSLPNDGHILLAKPRIVDVVEDLEEF